MKSLPLSSSSRAGFPRRIWAAGLLLSAILLPGAALAQGQLPDASTLSAGQGGGTPKADPNAPVTHAAPGEESSLPEGEEPALPDDPLALSDEAKKTLTSDAEPGGPPPNQKVDSRFYGFYFDEKTGDYRYRGAFPVWAERTQPAPTAADPKATDRASLYGGFYYQRRSPTHRDDVVFPLVWNLEDPSTQSRTTVVGPFVDRKTKTETDSWLPPLYLTGTREKGGYTIIPPLLTALTSNAEGGLNIVGPAFCSWQGGPGCDIRTASKIDLGIAPFYFFGQDKHQLYEVIPPLLHYYGYNAKSEDWVNIYGPYYREKLGERNILHLLPIYYSIWGKDEFHLSVLPLFHYGYQKQERLLITPLFVNHRGQDGATTFATWGYAQHRGRTELDMITPLLWLYREPSIGLSRTFLFPFLYTNKSPRENTVAVFPFFASSERYGISKSLWVTPLVNYNTHLDGWSLSVAPLLFFGRDGRNEHSVVAPFYWDFKTASTRTTFTLPLIVRFEDLDSVSTVVGNVYHRERRYKNGREWEVHILPLFSYGETPDGHFWNILFGLTGYTRKGSMSEMRLFYAPIRLSD